MKKAILAVFALGATAVIACGGGVTSPEDAPTKSSSSSGTSGATSSSGVTSSSSSSSGFSSSSSSSGIVLARQPKTHRAVATPCDAVRADYPSNAPDAGSPDPNGFIKCTSHAECTAGKNGRCNGNNHDGWQCTYDACTTDIECGVGNVCSCEGGFRADNNVCLPQNGCRTDSDCGAAGQGYCSPTLGSCGHYGKTESFQCHTPKDECVDDADCADGGAGPFGNSGYCSYEMTVGHWKCSTSECAG